VYFNVNEEPVDAGFNLNRGVYRADLSSTSSRQDVIWRDVSTCPPEEGNALGGQVAVRAAVIADAVDQGRCRPLTAFGVDLVEGAIVLGFIRRANRDLENYEAGNFLFARIRVGDESNNIMLGSDHPDFFSSGGGNDMINLGPNTNFVATGGGHDKIVFFKNTLEQEPAVSGGSGLENRFLDFDVTRDKFVFDANDYGLRHISFCNTKFGSGSGPQNDDLSPEEPIGDCNVIVVQNSDNDDDETTGFGAGAAANLVADAIQAEGDNTDSRAGLILYFNSRLALNRLFWSSDITKRTTDDPRPEIIILGRFTERDGVGDEEEGTIDGQDAVDNLPFWQKRNFMVLKDNDFEANALSVAKGGDADETAMEKDAKKFGDFGELCLLPPKNETNKLMSNTNVREGEKK